MPMQPTIPYPIQQQVVPPQDGTISQLIGALTKLTMRRPPQPRPRPVFQRQPFRPRRQRPPPKKQPQPKKPPQKQTAPKKTAPPKNPKKKQTKRPGKAQRNTIKFEADTVLSVLNDGKVVGYATMVGDKLIKPLHVKGEVDHPELKNLSFKKSTKLDLECADLPRQFIHQSLRHTVKRPSNGMGVYQWHHGPVQLADGRFTVPTSDKGGKGDSGRPILDNEGKVIAIVLGGAEEGTRRSLSVLTWNPKNAFVKDTPEGTVEWSAITVLCVLANTTFPCSQPACYPCCYEKDAPGTLNLLSANLNSTGYYDLMNAVTTCNETTTRRRRSVHVNAYKLTTPYEAYCADCGGKSCYSPVAIESVVDQAHQGQVRIQLSAQFGLLANDVENSDFVRYHQKTTRASAEMSKFSLKTTGKCTIISALGYFVVARCPPGKSLTASLAVAGVKPCTVPFAHSHMALGRELSQSLPHQSRTIKCLSYHPDVEDRNPEIPMHNPPMIPNGELIEETGGKVTIKVPSLYNVYYECRAGNSAEAAFIAQQKEVNLTGATKEHCRAFQVDIRKWQFASSQLPRTETGPVGKVKVPFELIEADCQVSLAPMPRVKPGLRKVTLEFHPQYPTLLTTRNLGDRNTTHEWINDTCSREFTVPESGFEYKWGNNDPERLWALPAAEGDPHGSLAEVVVYYYNRHPWTTVATAAVVGLAAAVSAFLTCCACRKIRRDCTNPYRLAPQAAVPTLMAVLCCIRGSRAETVTDSLKYLWTNNNEMFWAQLLVPMAALVMLINACRCLSPLCFFALLGIGNVAVDAYEHTVAIPNALRSPYKSLVTRKGYAPLLLSIEVVNTNIIPTLEQAYTTCAYKTVVLPPEVKCCGTLECRQKDKPDYQCRTFTGVYPFMWGGAMCFCDTENTQVSEAYVTESEACRLDSATAYKTHTAAASAQVRITLGNITGTINVRVNGASPGRLGDLKAVFGPLSESWTPFNEKIVVYDGKVYNYDFPEFGDPRPGVLGDLQISGSTVVAGTGLTLDRPNAGAVHSPYTQRPSGFTMWRRSIGPSLNDTAPFGCVINTSPVRATDCALGVIPASLDIPDAAFQRIIDAPTVTLKSCTVSVCTHSVDFGGAATFEYTSSAQGTCPIASLSNVATVKENDVALASSGSASFRFSTAMVQPNFRISVCSATVTCEAKCSPPSDKLVSKPVQYHAGEQAGVTSGLLSMAQIAGGSTVTIVLIAVVALAIVICVTNNKYYR